MKQRLMFAQFYKLSDIGKIKNRQVLCVKANANPIYIFVYFCFFFLESTVILSVNGKQNFLDSP